MLDGRVAWIAIVASLTLVAAGLAGCSGEATYKQPPEPKIRTKSSNLSISAKRQRAKVMKQVAASEGLTNPIVLAGIAEAETDFAHCHSEAPVHCPGPHSSYCGGPVLAGSADGHCSAKQGGLGMFQFDGGTYQDTLRRDGRQVLSLRGNIRHAIDFIANKVEYSKFIHGVSTRSEAIKWLNGVEVGGRRYHTWLKTVTAYYNGCFPSGCSVYQSRYNHYDNAFRHIQSALGASFWNRSASGGPADSSSSSSGSSSSGSSSSGTSGSGGSPGPQAPAEPNGVGPNWREVGNGGTVDLNWSGVAAADRYVVHMDVRDGGSWRDYYEWRTDDIPFRVWPQRDDSEYRWRIRACNSVGCSTWTDWRAFAVGHVPNASSSSSSNSGSSSSGASNSGASNSGASNSGASSSSASNSGSGGSSSSSSSSPLAVPHGLTPDQRPARGSRVPLDWEGSGGAVGYVVNVRYYDRGTGSWKHYDTWSDVGTSSMDLWPILDGYSYAWRVRACNRTRCSNWSGWATFYFDG